jgi:hypothetical protein
MSWRTWTLIWLLAVVFSAFVAALPVLAEAVGGGWWHALNALPYVVIFVGGGLLLTRNHSR